MHKIIKFKIIIKALGGKLKIKERYIPPTVAKTENTQAYIKTLLNFFAICKALVGGIIIKADTSIIPTVLTASTTTIAIKSTKRILILSTLTPAVLAKFSSKTVAIKAL